MDLLSLAKSKKYTEVYVGDTAEGLGSVKGAPCELISAVHDDENKYTIMTYKWTGNDGRVQTQDVRIPDGADGKDGELDVHFFEDRIEAISKADWESLTEAEAAGRNFLITDDEFNSNAFDIAYRDSDVGDALDGIINTIGARYSEEERCVGSWIDGKPLYRRVKYEELSSASNSASINMGISDIDLVINSFGYLINNYNNENQIIPTGFRTVDDSLFFTTSFSVSKNSFSYVRADKNHWISNTSKKSMVLAIVEYTKTTDEPNSFTTDMLTGFSELIDALKEAK